MLLRAVMLLLLVVAAPAQSNTLKNHPSPYLALHGDDPVAWREWQASTLNLAQQQNKLLFVSVGYFSCHWCHVMQRESFADAAIAEQLNTHFVPVKVDRELHPVLDKRLIDFVQATLGRAGWPLNVILTPEGYPLTGATYLPKAHFNDALRRIAQYWQSEPDRLRQDARDMHAQMARGANASDQKGTASSLGANRGALLAQLQQQADKLEGGFGQQNKFPMAMQLRSLLRLNRRERREDIDDYLQLTLDQMQNVGLHDQISGGFFRYTVDPGWETPHFEKMLYTNALLAELFMEASVQYAREDYRETAIQTLTFVGRDMRAQGGGFISSLSATDDQDVEGGFYLFEQDVLRNILTPEALELVNQAWGMTRPEDLEGGVLPHRVLDLTALAQNPKRSPAEVRAALADAAEKLHAWRTRHRVLPRDDKRLAHWNGLLLSAFAKIYDVAPALREDGKGLSRFLIGLTNGDTLYRSALRKAPATLGGYAAVALSLQQWGAVAGDPQASRLGEQMTRQAWERFFIAGGWLESDGSLLPGDYRRKHLPDSSLPSPESLLLEATGLLPDTAENRPYKIRAKAQLSLSTQGVEANPFVYASLITLAP